MIKEITIKNYKSIKDETIELGRFNVFIGENTLKVKNNLWLFMAKV